jgi:hypothetical protein
MHEAARQHRNRHNHHPAGANYSQAYSGMWGWSDAPCATPAPSLCEMRPVGNFSYDVAAAAGDPAGSGTVYTLVTAAAGFEAAQLACNGIGGHLAAFSSVAEQRDAEQYFVQLVGASGLRAVCCAVLCCAD